MLKKYRLTIYASGKKDTRVAVDLLTSGDVGEIFLPSIARFQTEKSSAFKQKKG